MDISLLFFFPCLKKWQTPLSCPHGLGPCARASANQWAWHRKHVTTVTSALQVLRTKCSPTQTRNARFWSNADSRPVHLGMCNNYYYIVMCDSMYSSSAYVLNVHDWQALRYLGCVSSEHRRWTPRADLSKRKGKKPSRDTFNSPLEEHDAITLLQEGSLLILAVLLSSYGA